MDKRYKISRQNLDDFDVLCYELVLKKLNIQ